MVRIPTIIGFYGSDESLVADGDKVRVDIPVDTSVDPLVFKIGEAAGGPTIVNVMANQLEDFFQRVSTLVDLFNEDGTGSDGIEVVPGGPLHVGFEEDGERTIGDTVNSGRVTFYQTVNYINSANVEALDAIRGELATRGFTVGPAFALT